MPDECDIVSGLSIDCDNNAIPDECNPVQTDCNGNSLLDHCDIADGTSLDCNINNVPDECDLGGGSSEDCNYNAIPDECEPYKDCNFNGLQDICDLAEGTSTDCNFDEVPDECQPYEDCNGNLVRDSCDIAQGTSFDNNGDGRPDECCMLANQPQFQRQFDENGDSTGAPEPKNRALAFNANNTHQKYAIRVTWGIQPNWTEGNALLVGQQKWLAEPFQVCENSGDGLAIMPPNCGAAPGQPQKWFWAARLECDPYYTKFPTLSGYCSGSGEACAIDADCASGTCGVDNVIHIFDQGVVPSKNMDQQAIYSLQVIAEECPIVEGNFSTALVFAQPLWGDIGEGTNCPMLSPAGVAALIPDVTKALAKFSNEYCAPKKTRVDVEPAVLDMRIGISDVLQLLNAFASGSTSYAFEAGPACSAGG